MEERPLVSIITGYYNRKDNLKESVTSVLEQSYANFEYIVFDDCSTDGTRELLETFDDPRFTLIKHTQNMGFTKGLIHAISKAKGEFIALHGAGDISHKERISSQVNVLLNDKDVGIVGCLVEDVTAVGVEIQSPVVKDDRSNFDFSHGEVMYRSSLYYLAGGYNTLFNYGQFTMLKMEILKLSKGAFVNEVLYRRINYSNGVSKNISKIIEQKISISLGLNLSRQGIWGVDISTIVVAFSLLNIRYLKPKSTDEKRFLLHARRKGMHFVVLYYLYKKKLIPARVMEGIVPFFKKIKSRKIR